MLLDDLVSTSVLEAQVRPARGVADKVVLSANGAGQAYTVVQRPVRVVFMQGAQECPLSPGHKLLDIKAPLTRFGVHPG